MMAAMGDDFLDVRTHGFARVAVSVPEVRVADPAFNAEAHLRLLEQVHREGEHYALCPELGLSGYSCADLFFQETLLAASLAALGRVAAATAEWNLIMSVGMPLVVDDLLFNCAVTLFRGHALAVAPKAFPPNYREFYERRWFHAAADARAREITLLGERVPFGTDVLVAAPHLPGFVLHTDICEDLWTPVPPGTIAALSGATVLANLSASNITVASGSIASSWSPPRPPRTSPCSSTAPPASASRPPTWPGTATGSSPSGASSSPRPPASSSAARPP